MDLRELSNPSSSFLAGVREALPLVGGYIPIAMSFGLIAVQAGFSSWEAMMISTLIYAGGSQFLFVGMYSAGAPLWLIVVSSLLVNARHVVYGPGLSPWTTSSRWWPFLIHGLTDQVFAIAHTRLPQLKENERPGWFSGIMLFAWASWIGGTAIGAFSGAEIISQWPQSGEIAAFALPALFLALLAPLATSRHWLVTLCLTIVSAITLSTLGVSNFAIPLSALLGSLCFYVMKSKKKQD